MIILGLNIFHAESSACIIKNGDVVASCEEERFTHIKNFAGFPLNSLQYCLREANINSLNDLDYISINSHPYYNIKEKLLYAFKKIFSVNFLPRLALLKKKHDVYEILKENYKENYKKKVNFVPHHRSHISLAFLSSGMKEAIGFSYDAAGDFSTAEAYYCDEKQIKLLKKSIFPHSLGILYQAMTQFVGFKKYGDEYKFMGLASYGEPVYLDQIRKLVTHDKDNFFKLNLKYFRHQIIGFSFNFETCSPRYQNLFSHELEKLLGPSLDSQEKIGKREMDIACSTQQVFEEIVFQILKNLKKEFNTENLVLSGGCSLNSSLNGKILEKTNFKNLYIPSNCGDAGGALGSALDTLFHLDKKNFKIKKIEKTYWGPKYSNEYIENNIINNLSTNLKSKIQIKKFNKEIELYNFVTEELTNFKIVSWFQGELEFGPRALGNRSILADPRKAEMKEIINKKIKLRESFRPFAPSILIDKFNDYFDYDQSIPFMNQVIKVKEKMKNKIPAVVHVDGTARAHTVSRENNEKYYCLIKKFYEKTGVPILLNTSFNIDGPICESPEDAYGCFINSDLDLLVMENWVLKKNDI